MLNIASKPKNEYQIHLDFVCIYAWMGCHNAENDKCGYIHSGDKIKILSKLKYNAKFIHDIQNDNDIYNYCLERMPFQDLKKCFDDTKQQISSQLKKL